MKYMETKELKRHKFYLKTADELGKLFSTCVNLSVGTILVKDNRIISTGYNGVPSGMPHCIQSIDEYANNFSVEHHIFSEAYEIHAEMNSIIYAAKTNVVIDDSVILYSSIQPCNNCLKHIIATGIKKVYYIELYNQYDTEYNIVRRKLAKYLDIFKQIEL